MRGRILQTSTFGLLFVVLVVSCGAGAADTTTATSGADASPAATAGAASSPASNDWRALNRRAREQRAARDAAGLHDTLVRLAPSLPGSPTIVYNLAASAARLGLVDEAASSLARLADAGLYYDIGADDDFAALAQRADFLALRQRFAANERPLGSAMTLMRFAWADALPESLAWDARTRRLFVSSVRHCEIRVFADPTRRTAGDARGRRFALLPAPVFALGIDAARRRLWATIATVPQGLRCGEGPAAAERTALVALDLRSGRVVQRVEAGVPGVLGDMLVGDDGTVFVSESAHGAVLRLRPGAGALERLDHEGDFVSPQMPALSVDRRTLLVPDYARGIAALDLRACPCEARWLANGAGVFTAGIDGFVADGTGWVAVQNGTSPPRLIRFAGDFSRQEVLESSTPELGEPTHAIVVGRSLWFITDVGWDRFDASGKRKDEVPAPHSELRSLSLGGTRRP